MATNRNDLCPCGSGQKYKKCCLKSGGTQRRNTALIGAVLAVLVAALAFAVGHWLDRSLGIVTAVGGLGGIGAFIMFSDPPSARKGGDPSSINFGG